jgi:valyl-tRNA synthetase
LARLKSFAFCDSKPEKMAVAVLEQAELYVNLAEHLDIGAEIARNEAALKKVQKEIERHEGKLNNAGFMERAPQAIKDAERAQLQVEMEKRGKLEETLKELRELAVG